MDHFENAYPIVFLSALSDPIVYFTLPFDIFQHDDKNIRKSQKCQFFFHYIVFLNMKVLSDHFDRKI